MLVYILFCPFIHGFGGFGGVGIRGEHAAALLREVVARFPLRGALDASHRGGHRCNTGRRDDVPAIQAIPVSLVILIGRVGEPKSSPVGRDRAFTLHFLDHARAVYRINGGVSCKVIHGFIVLVEVVAIRTRSTVSEVSLASNAMGVHAAGYADTWCTRRIVNRMVQNVLLYNKM